MIYKEVGAGSYASVDVSCTAEGYDNSTLVNAVKSGGWGNPQVVQVATSDTEQEYKVSVTTIPGDEGKSFQILGFAVT